MLCVRVTVPTIKLNASGHCGIEQMRTRFARLNRLLSYLSHQKYQIYLRYHCYALREESNVRFQSPHSATLS
jgi:hypothetical protein